jgi:hypothetical protein
MINTLQKHTTTHTYRSAGCKLHNNQQKLSWVMCSKQYTVTKTNIWKFRNAKHHIKDRSVAGEYMIYTNKKLHSVIV